MGAGARDLLRSPTRMSQAIDFDGASNRGPVWQARATLVVLADERPGWRPDSYEEELWGCRVQFSYPICKLLDFARDREALEASSNPAAVVIAAHPAAKASRGNMELRKRSK